jgi:hypothetical protein
MIYWKIDLTQRAAILKTALRGTEAVKYAIRKALSTEERYQLSKLINDERIG